MDWLFRLALVVHIAGILWLASAITLELLGSLLLRQATDYGGVRSAGSLLKQLPKFFGPSSALILLSGLYLSGVRLDHKQSIGWVVVSLIAFLFMAITGAAGGRKTGLALKAELQRGKGNMTDGLRQLTRETVGLRQGLTAVCTVVGIVILMVCRPNVRVSIVVMVVAMSLGLVITSWINGKLTA